MAKSSKPDLGALASTKALQLLIALLFIAMGMMGFASASGAGSQLSKELSSMLGGDQEIVLYIISALQLVCGLFLGAHLFTKIIPAKIAVLALTAIMVFWIVLIIILDVLTVNFGRLQGADWFAWIEQVVLHLIVLASILQIRK